MFTTAHHEGCGGEVEIKSNKHPKKGGTWICTRCGRLVSNKDLTEWKTYLLGEYRLSSPHANQLLLDIEQEIPSLLVSI